MNVLNIDGRPAVITGSRQKAFRRKSWGHFLVVKLRFLDGLGPATAEIPKGKLLKYRAVRPAEAIYWVRVDGLIREGMTRADAIAHATNEQAKGMLSGAAAAF